MTDARCIASDPPPLRSLPTPPIPLFADKPTGDFAVTPVPGDTLIVEVVVPASAAGEPIVVVVGTVVHHYVGTRLTGSQGATHPAVADARARRGFGDSGACTSCGDLNVWLIVASFWVLAPLRNIRVKPWSPALSLSLPPPLTF